MTYHYGESPRKVAREAKERKAEAERDLRERAAYAESQGWCTYAQALERLATADLIARMMVERDAAKRARP